jgi:hypothetical protein
MDRGVTEGLGHHKFTLQLDLLELITLDGLGVMGGPIHSHRNNRPGSMTHVQLDLQRAHLVEGDLVGDYCLGVDPLLYNVVVVGDIWASKHPGVLLGINIPGVVLAEGVPPNALAAAHLEEQKERYHDYPNNRRIIIII